MKAKSKVVVLLVVVAVLSWASFWHWYFLSVGDNAELVCNSQECLLFNSQSMKGYRYTPFTFANSFVGALLAAPDFPSVEKDETLVFRITPSGVEKSSVPELRSVWGIYAGQIYGGGGGGAWRWENGRIQVLDKAEVASFDLGTQRHEVLIRGERNGWTVREFNPADEFRTSLNGIDIHIVSNHDGRGSRVINAEIGGKKIEVWQRNSGPRKISKDEYKNLFSVS